MANRWLYAWGAGSGALGVASLLVPLYVVALDGGPAALGLLAASAALLGTPGALLWGRLADRTENRRAVVVGSLLGAAAALGAMPFLDSVAAVLAANAVLWFVSAAAAPVLTLLAVADAPERTWSRRIAALDRWQGFGWASGLFVVVGATWAVVGATWAVIAVTVTELVTRHAPAAVRGEALGVHAALVAAAGGVGGVLGGWTAGFGYPTTFAVAGGLVAAGAGMVVALRGLSDSGDARAGTTRQENTTD